MLSLFGLAIDASAQPLEDISLRYSENGIVATIRLSGPVSYLRHNPLNHGKTLEIYYDRLPDSSGVVWRDSDSLKSPPSNLIPSFTVVTRDQGVRPKLVIEFSRPARFSVAEGDDDRSFLITIQPDKKELTPDQVISRLPTVKPLASLGSQAAADVNKQAFGLMTDARNALARNDNSGAIDIFNKLLSLPPNPYTPDAQEWIGVARERDGQAERAKAEYELYLKLYPQGDGVDRVKIRLAKLRYAKESSTLLSSGATEDKANQSMAYGSITSHYYHGASTTDSTYLFNNVQQTTSTGTVTDQSMQVTTADATGRFLSDKLDNRIVFRDVQTHNFLANTSGNTSYTQDVNRIYSAYWETKGRQSNFDVRVGRQLGTGGGVFGRYDGVSGSYGTPEDWRANAVYGQAVDFTSLTKPTFYGASVDKGPVSVYVLNQTVDGVLDRQAVGSELHYFDSGSSAYAQVDYDVSFKALNIAMFSGTLAINDDGANINFMVDHRRTPPLSISNALMGSSASSISTLLQFASETELRSLAQTRTGTSDFSQIGITYPLNKQWQLGGDVRFSKISGIPATVDPVSSTTLAATPGTGFQRTLTTQVTGNSLLTTSDIWSASLNLMQGVNLTGRSLYMYNRSPVAPKWTLDTAWLYYKQDSSSSGNIVRNTPSVRATYSLTNQLSFDGEFGVEVANITGASQNQTTKRVYGSLGFNWDF